MIKQNGKKLGPLEGTITMNKFCNNKGYVNYTNCTIYGWLENELMILFREENRNLFGRYTWLNDIR